MFKINYQLLVNPAPVSQLYGAEEAKLEQQQRDCDLTELAHLEFHRDTQNKSQMKKSVTYCTFLACREN
jgi:hypothetical protein